MIFYEYVLEKYSNTPTGRKKMDEDLSNYGDDGYRVHTVTPLYYEGIIRGYEVLYERERTRE